MSHHCWHGGGCSVDKYGRLVDIGSILDLSNQKVGHILTGNEAVTPLRRFAKDCVPSRSAAGGQNPGPNNRPIKGTVLDHTFLHTLVIVCTAEEETERDAL